MIKGIFASGSGMRPRMMKLEIIGNNLANINTTGYKKENVFIQLMKDSGLNMAKGNGELAGLDVKEYTDYSEGSLNQTSNQLDLAIQGRGFFVVDTPQGERYTRNGNFMLTADGTVVTNEGYPVLGKTGRIQIPDLHRLSQGDLTISEKGEIFVDKRMVAQVRVDDFDNLNELTKDGHSLFASPVPGKPITPDGTTSIIRQGFLEESNVDGIDEMIMMVELSRSFETDQKSVQYQDGTLERAMDIGRL